MPREGKPEESKGRPGWIKLWRQILDHELFDDRPYAKGQAWIYLLCWAAWAKKEERFFQKRLFILPRGQHVTTLRQLARDWGWSHPRVRRFLEILEKCSMISSKMDHHCIVITICNFDTWQASDDAPFHETKKNDPIAIQSRSNRDPIAIHEVRREEGKEGGEAPPSALRTEEELLSETVAFFEGWGLPGPGEREKAVRELRRQGVSHERIREAARENVQVDFYAIFDLLKNGKAKPPFIRNHHPTHHIDPLEAKEKESVIQEIDRLLQELPEEERKVWLKDAQERASRERVLGVGLPIFIQSDLRVRMARKKGISGV